MENSTEFAAARLSLTGSLYSLLLVSLLALTLSVFLGRYPEPYFTTLSDIMESGLAREILLGIRIPRVLFAFLLGMTLTASGTVFQMVFRNPLVDSGFLGVSGGAAFGASLAIVCFGGNPGLIQISAAAFACIGLAASYGVARRIRLGDWVLRLVLSGIAVSAIYASGTGTMKYMADPMRELPDITFWLLGGLWAVTWIDTVEVLIIASPCLMAIYLMRWRLNLLSMQDDTAFSLVSAPDRERLVLLLAAVVSTAALVSKAGQIGWVGLIVPHIARRIVGSDAQSALPFGILAGGLFSLVCDDVARILLTGEIPLGILTSFSGATVFIILLMTNRLSLKQK